jgi:proline iminopeptidase
MRADLADAVYSPDVLREAATSEYGTIDVRDRLGAVSHPVLVLAGRHDRTCSVEAAQAIADGTPESELVIFDESGHMMFVEEQDKYVAAVADFLARRATLTPAH